MLLLIVQNNTIGITMVTYKFGIKQDTVNSVSEITAHNNVKISILQICCSIIILSKTRLLTDLFFTIVNTAASQILRNKPVVVDKKPPTTAATVLEIE